MKGEVDSFLAYVMDALAGVEGLRSRAMFGGVGLYSKDDFFGIVWNGTLYFRVDEKTRPLYEKHGSCPFTYRRDGKKMAMKYFEVPADVLDDHEKMLVWADGAVKAARAAKAEKKKRA